MPIRWSMTLRPARLLADKIQAADTLRHQADEMRQRWLQIQRIYHGKL